MNGVPDDLEALRLERLNSQLLAGQGGDSAEEVVGRILAVQAQDDRGCRLAIRSRAKGLSAHDVDEALNDRRLVITWLNRGTLHLVRTEDYSWLHPLTAPRSATTIDHRLRQLGVSERQAQRGVDVIVEGLNTEGPLLRRDLKVRLDAAGVATEGQALVYLLGTASHMGLIVRGPMRGSEQAFVSVESWLGRAPSALEPNEALGRLAMRYLEGHEPAAPLDMAKWAGITLGQARLGFRQLADQIRSLGEGFVRRARLENIRTLPPTLLLGPFDPLLHGWASREIWVGSHRSVVTANGIFRATAFSAGRVKGTWRFSAGGIRIELLEGIDKKASDDLVRDALDVIRFMGMTVEQAVISIERADK